MTNLLDFVIFWLAVAMAALGVTAEVLATRAYRRCRKTLDECAQFNRWANEHHADAMAAWEEAKQFREEAEKFYDEAAAKYDAMKVEHARHERELNRIVEEARRLKGE